MTAQEHPYPRVEMLIDIFGDWLKRRRELSEIRQMDSGDFDRIASELRVSPGELDTLVRRDRMPRTSCQSCLGHSASTKPIWRAPSQWCCATWSGFARCATKNANATAISPPRPPPSTMRDIA
jgi:hypothetical protein